MAVRVSELLRDGQTPGRIRRMPTPYWGIRDDRLPVGLEERCRAFLPRIGTACFSHVTAARLWGLPLPWRVERDDRLHVAFPAGHRAPRATGVVGHELAFRPGDTAQSGGLPLTSPARTWRDLAGVLATADLVALGDAILRRSPFSATGLDAQSRIVGVRGRRRMLEALPLLDARAESPQESLLRVALIRSGMPALEVNPVLRDSHGRFVARVDLKFVDFPVVVEFDGDIHRSDPATWRRDVERHADIQDLGLDLVRVLGDDSPRFVGAVARVSRRLIRHGWTPSRTHSSR